jgi:aryl-alcohol dehydrogenase-like predicted oxidoreductase
MRYTTIGGADLRPSVLCLGAGDIGSKIDRETSFRLLDAFVDGGGNFLDTAQVYADWLPGERSISEKTLGAWLAARRARASILIGTKGAHPRLETMHVPRMSRAEIVHDLDNSLKNLRTDVIDLYWLHRDAPAVPVEEIIDILQDQVQAGKIRYFGCSNWQRPRIEAAQAYAARRGLQGFIANQLLWNIGVVDLAGGDPTIVAMDPALWVYHRRTGLAAIPFSSQANGFFNKLAAGQTAAIKPHTRRIYCNPENQLRFQRIQQLAQETSLSITQIVLGYLLAQPFTTIPIVGCQTLEQLQDSLAAASVQLTPEQVKFLEGDIDHATNGASSAH